MSRIYKRIFSMLFSLVLVVCSCFYIAACSCKDDKDDTSKVMNLSLNPSIELILDKEDKVVSVNALNDEGNYIVANVELTGLSAEDAIDAFLKATKENGFIIDGEVSADENQLKISISGENAENLFNQVKASANEYLSNANLNVNITLEEKLTREYLESIVEECMQELTSEEIKAKTDEELIELIKSSREETKELYSQELKDLYYQARYEEILKAKYDEISTLLAENSLIGAAIKPTFDVAFSTFTSKIDEFRNLYIEKFLSDTSVYQCKMQEYIEAKKDLLEARVNTLSDQEITTATNAVQEAQKALDNAKQSASQALLLANSAIETALMTLQTTIDTLAEQLNQDAINTAMTTAKTNFKTTFENSYQSYINNDYWNNLKPNIVD